MQWMQNKYAALYGKTKKKKKQRKKKNQTNTVDNNDKQRAFNRTQNTMKRTKRTELIELTKHVKRNRVEIQLHYVDVRLVNGEHLVMLKHSFTCKTENENKQQTR